MTKLSSKSLLIFLIAALLLASPVLADKRRGGGMNGPPGYSLDRAVEGVRSSTGGRVLSADTRSRDGRSIYDIKVLTDDGRVRRMAIDGETGETLRRRPR